mmetsp:Transcript_24622/g.73208  ORF Transcript_24622/g.73208 Transcript_24622/m.73208 type:complete len:205 (-) Transcript_24622:613-1227(-)
MDPGPHEGVSHAGVPRVDHEPVRQELAAQPLPAVQYAHEGQEARHRGHGRLPERGQVLGDQHAEAEEGLQGRARAGRDARLAVHRAHEAAVPPRLPGHRPDDRQRLHAGHRQGPQGRRPCGAHPHALRLHRRGPLACQAAVPAAEVQAARGHPVGGRRAVPHHPRREDGQAVQGRRCAARRGREDRPLRLAARPDPVLHSSPRG